MTVWWSWHNDNSLETGDSLTCCGSESLSFFGRIGWLGLFRHNVMDWPVFWWQWCVFSSFGKFTICCLIIKTYESIFYSHSSPVNFILSEWSYWTRLTTYHPESCFSSKISVLWPSYDHLPHFYTSDMFWYQSVSATLRAIKKLFIA